MTITAFNALLGSVQSADKSGEYAARLTEDWLQGRAGFGGIMAAMATTALRQEIGDERPLRALMTSFVGPPGAGDLDIECNVLRSGKSVTWADARISQNGEVCTTFSACFGGGRESSIHVETDARPHFKSLEDSQVLPYMAGLNPAFHQHFDMRWALGGFPMSGSSQSEMGVWLRYKQPAEFGEAHVVALMDALPPAVYQMFKQMRPISSLTWHLELLDDLTAQDARDDTGWWFCHMFAQGAARGYSQQHAVLYTPAGRAIAMSQQAVAIFA